PGMFWMKDIEGKFLLVNDRNDQFLKVSNLTDVDSVIGKSDFDFLTREEADYYQKEDLHVIQSRSPLVVEEYKTVDGNIVWYEKFKFPVVDKQGEVIGVSAYSMDISGRKKLEQSLFEAIEREKELNELKTKFISVASHEFRTPLATILASSESLSSYWDRMSAEQREQRLDKIKNQVGQLNKIIEEILHLSKIQAKDKALEPEMFDIALMCGEIIDEFRNRPGELPKIEFNPGADPVNVYLDKKKMRMVITNLLSNAMKYTEPGKRVTVKIRQEKNRFTLMVRDQGIGIPKDDIKHLFEPFFRASNAGNFSGTGLGLNIVKESVIRHAGKINVRSKINAGTLFTVNLPLSVESIRQIP
ncbi:MAG: PAS domain-containing sensor histidine kinase, partial [bacterium]